MGRDSDQASFVEPGFSHNLILPYPPPFINYWKPTPTSNQRFKQKSESGDIYLRKSRHLIDEYKRVTGTGMIIEPCTLHAVFRLPERLKKGVNLGGDLNGVMHSLRFGQLIYRESCIRETFTECEDFHFHGIILGEVEIWLEGVK